MVLALITAYLGAILWSNWSVAAFGPRMVLVNALLFISLDLTVRDKLDDLWHRRGLWWKMPALIVAGSGLSALINAGVRHIALASLVAFAASEATDTAIYAVLRDRRSLVRMNGSNVVSGLVDSAVFLLIAFGWSPAIGLLIVGQWAAKVLGGSVWSMVLGYGRRLDTRRFGRAWVNRRMRE